MMGAMVTGIVGNSIVVLVVVGLMALSSRRRRAEAAMPTSRAATPSSGGPAWRFPMETLPQEVPETAIILCGDWDALARPAVETFSELQEGTIEAPS
jgi:uncharacterized iron-regulated membrane protein